jgi:hypothetical protein
LISQICRPFESVGFARYKASKLKYEAIMNSQFVDWDETKTLKRKYVKTYVFCPAIPFCACKHEHRNKTQGSSLILPDIQTIKFLAISRTGSVPQSTRAVHI